MYFQIEKLENEIKEDIYIPNEFIIQNQKSKELFTYIVWSESIPLIIPKVDFIILVKKYKKFLKVVQEIGIVKYQDIINKFAPYFDIYDSKNGLLILNQRNADKIKNDFISFPIWKSHKDFGPQVGLDNFVNNR